MIRLQGVTKQFGENLVLNNIDLDIHLGEIFGIIGLSGAGKSTLLRLINGLEQKTSGTIEIADSTRFGFVFQNFNLVNSLSVKDNILLALINEDQTEQEKENRVNEVLQLVGLSGKVNMLPKNLSGGERQRVGIARALVAGINVLLCDEATSALDPFTANEIICLLKKLNEDLNLTIIFVSHQLEIVKDFCDRIAIVDRGEIYEVNQTIDIFSNPQSEIAIRLLSNILGFNQFANNPEVGFITQYGQTAINQCIKKIVNNNINIRATYQHQTKQGKFAHIFVDNQDLCVDYEVRRIHGL